MLASLGLFVFEPFKVAFDELQQKINYRYGTGNAVGVRPRMQYIGPDNDTISFSGVVYPELAGSNVASIDELIAMGNTGKTYALLDGTGRFYGMFYIESINRNQSHLLTNGSPRKIGFDISLKLQDDNNREAVAVLDQDRA
ncbi:oxidoreductase [Moraxella osloensis]|uniref:Oxidoreductase n=1 Tax=Faucicola osloensis TaxID=34062 RepID=A0A2I1RIW7_FAUOS|nr:phage tail protein [Moraxella osloensis]PKZ69079.1 oxidoreductase [Moraxella osloensis]